MSARACLLGVLLLLGGSRVCAQQPGPRGGEPSLELPTPEQLFRVESEAQSLARIGLERGKPIAVPPVAVLPPAELPYFFPPQTAFMPQAVVCYHTLYFENRWADRDAYSMGLLQAAGMPFRFYAQAITLPVRAVIVPPWWVRCSYR